MFVEMMLPGQPTGEIGSRLGEVGFDPGYNRPYFNAKGDRVVSVFTGKMKLNESTGKKEPVRVEVPISKLQSKGIQVNNATIMKKDQWIQIDEAVYMAARERLSAWSDLLGRSSYGNFDAMSKLTLEYYAMNDVGQAVVDLDALTDGRNDRPLMKLRSLPLPITHSDFQFSARELAVSRNGRGVPLDTTMAEMAGRRVAEAIEKQLIGIDDGIQYGGVTTGQFAHDGNSQIYGYINHPSRSTKTNMTVPDGTNPSATVTDVIAMRETLIANKFYGPYMLYYSTDWDQYLDQDYAFHGAGTSWGVSPTMTLRDRLKRIDGIVDAKRLDFLTPTANNAHAFTMVLVQMTRDVVQAVNGMEITTLQWESKGGLQINFKVMCIQVPRLMSKYDGTMGLVHGRTA
jgi:uncharacterized linocin/CFP29 family protein